MAMKLEIMEFRYNNETNQKSGASSSYWECTTCTYRNVDSDTRHCIFCGSRRLTERRQHEHEDKKVTKTTFNSEDVSFRPSYTPSKAAQLWREKKQDGGRRQLADPDFDIVPKPSVMRKQTSDSVVEDLARELSHLNSNRNQRSNTMIFKLDSSAVSDSFRRDLANQREIFKKRDEENQGISGMDMMTDSLRKDIEQQQEIYDQIASSNEQIMDDQGYSQPPHEEDIYSRVQKETAGRESFSSGDLSASLKHDILHQKEIMQAVEDGAARYKQDRKASNQQGKTSLQSRRKLSMSLDSYLGQGKRKGSLSNHMTRLVSSPSAAALAQMEKDYHEERQNFEKMQNLVDMKRYEIEQIRGINLDEIMGTAKRPGVCSVPQVAEEWIAQQNMLSDWNERLVERGEELEAIRESRDVFRDIDSVYF